MADADTFKDAGFSIAQLGGGTTGWFKGLPNDYFLLITDSGGSDHTLGDKHSYAEDKPDCYMIGIHHESAYIGEDTYSERATAAEAIEEAARFEANPPAAKLVQP